MKKVIRLLIVALCLTVAPTTVSAQELVILTTNNELTFSLDDAFHIYPDGDYLIILDRSARPSLVKVSEIKEISFRGSSGMKGDVNEDKAVDVADIATIIDIMAGKGDDTQPEEKAYPTCSNLNHPHWIDLGLPSGTKWRCCNHGASKPEDYGDLYIFDEAQAYNPPSRDQIKELLDNTTSEWTTRNGVYGRKFTGSNGGSVFFPAAGYFEDGELYDVGSLGVYWSSTPGGEKYAYYLFCTSEQLYWSSCGRYYGHSVRPVR